MEEVLRLQLTWCCAGQGKGCSCERDDQADASGEDLPYYEVFAGTLHGPDGRTKFVEDCETGSCENLTQNQRKGSEVTEPFP